MADSLALQSPGWLPGPNGRFPTGSLLDCQPGSKNHRWALKRFLGHTHNQHRLHSQSGKCDASHLNRHKPIPLQAQSKVCVSMPLHPQPQDLPDLVLSLLCLTVMHHDPTLVSQIKLKKSNHFYCHITTAHVPW